MKDFFKKDNLRYGLVGSGSWATALAKLILNNQSKINWYVRDDELAMHIQNRGHNPYYLPSVSFEATQLNLTTDINEVINNSDVLVFCIPSVFFISEVSKITTELKNKFIISAIKGIISEDNLTIAEYFHIHHHIPYDMIGVVSGPSHAEEIAMERLTFLTLSSKHLEVAESLCSVFSCNYVKTIPGTDIYGVEYAAVLKNVYAVGAGICHALSYGDNFMSVFITNCFNEMKRFLNASHPTSNRITSTSAYLGDLLVTSYSQYSRNRTFGSMIGKGITVQAAQVEMNMVAEGYYGSKAIHDLSKKLKLDMPIAESVYTILYDKKYPSNIIKQLIEKLN